MITTLTDRYLWAAARAVPEAQREEFRRELAERIGDDIDARVGAGATASEAEYLALSALGDPNELVSSYLDRPLQLIGPRYYLVWSRLLKILAATVLPSVAVAVALGLTIAHHPFGEIVGTTIVTLITVAVHLGFWTTLVFAVIERSTGGQPMVEWKPELLPQLAEPPRAAMRADFIANLVFIAILAFLVLWHTVFLPFRDAAGDVIPLFQPDTWAWLEWYLLALLAAELVFWIVLFRHDHWNLWFASVNLVLSAAFAAPVVWLLANDLLFDHDFLDRTGWVGYAELIAPGGVLTIVLSFLVVGLAAWDASDGFVKAFRAARGPRMLAD